MKVHTKLIAIAGIIIIIIIMSLPKSAQTATQYEDPDVMFQTWEEFLESGVQIEYDNTSTITDGTDCKTTGQTAD